MAVKLRLMRMGAKKKPFYRIVAADSRTKRDGKYIELIGTYNPVVNPAELKINEETALKWLSTGAIPTDTVKSLFNQVGINEKFHNLKHQKKEKPAEKKTVAKKTTTKKAETKKEEKPATKKTTTKKATTTKTTTKKPSAKTTKKESK